MSKREKQSNHERRERMKKDRWPRAKPQEAEPGAVE